MTTRLHFAEIRCPNFATSADGSEQPGGRCGVQRVGPTAAAGVKASGMVVMAASVFLELVVHGGMAVRVAHL